MEEISREMLVDANTRFRSISDIDYVVEVLAKELGRSDDRKAQIISNFLQELGDLASLKEVLWSYIKSPASSDELKDICSVILKNLGDDTDPEEFLNYLDDPKAVVDKETQKLLEVASINPEAQIDFLDFLFSLPEQEQINLVSSLKEDYSSENLVNIVVPALEAHTSQRLEEELVRILGETRSPLAVPPLNDVVKYSPNKLLAKQAEKSLKMLKLAGINIEEEYVVSCNSDISRSSKMYECHTNIVDGVGNQGFIISRIKPNMDILMLNVVVNDVHGIIDCFGFYGISKSDFKRIIEKFQETTTRVFVPAEYCKYRLMQAEKINKENGMPVPYEYAAWKALICDVEPQDEDLNALCKEWMSKELINETALLYKFPDFQHWFFEEEDYPQLGIVFESIIEQAISQKDVLTTNESKLKNWFHSLSDSVFELVFDDEVRLIYKNRLLDVMYLLINENLPHFKDISASLAWAIDPENGYDIKTIPFFKEMVKKTIIECLVRHQYKVNNMAAELPDIAKKIKTEEEQEIDREDLTLLIDMVCNLGK